jgi:succinate dehydrogenase flavin-adding protein (antitoxin of CptAB toxin-antitoxin module)
MNAWELQQLDHLLNDPDSDWQLFYWISGKTQLALM